MKTLIFQIKYEWTPFKVNGRHLIFHEYKNNGIRLERGKCSHWGAAIYKWEGTMTEGANKGKTGILIGETDDIRARLNQYKSGTQKSGNKYWREDFLRNGRIGYWVLNLKECFRDDKTMDHKQIERKNFRLVLEQLLVMELLGNCDQFQTWVVNKMQ
ncbi:MAG: hypothetical protein U9N77_11205 [Thermodesulfobacteriota bacterium]|nr:hypothetical protein [Thermodesulfobacteriota bacterium]